MKTLSVLIAGVMCLLTEACTEPQTDMSRLCGGMEKYHRETGYTDRQGREELQADALCQKGDDGKNGSGKLSDPAEGRGDVH